MKAIYLMIAVLALGMVPHMRAQDVEGIENGQKISTLVEYQKLTFIVSNKDQVRPIVLDVKQAESVAAAFEKIGELYLESTRSQTYQTGKEIVRLSLPNKTSLSVTYTYLQAGNRRVTVTNTLAEQSAAVDLTYAKAEQLGKNLRKAIKKMGEKTSAPTNSTFDPYSTTGS